jgi:hypothetical protein
VLRSFALGIGVSVKRRRGFCNHGRKRSGPRGFTRTYVPAFKSHIGIKPLGVP